MNAAPHAPGSKRHLEVARSDLPATPLGPAAPPGMAPPIGMAPSIGGGSSRVEAEVLRLRALMGQGRFVEAVGDAQRLLGEVPENRDVLYLVAVAQRYLKRLGDALATLQRLESLHPNYSRLFQERGHLQVAAGDPLAAIQAYLAAVTINPALPASWRALHWLFRAAGRPDEAQNAADHVAALAELPADVVTARSLFADGEVHEAERVVRGFLRAHGNHVEAMRLLAQIGVRLDILDDAEMLLDHALLLAPGHQAARHDYVGVLLRRHRHARALAEVLKLLQADPLDRAARTLHAAVLTGLGDHEGALRAYGEVLREMPDAADLRLSVGHCLKTLGRGDEAIAAYRAAALARPDHGDAYWSLANLKTYAFDDDEIRAMRAAECAPGTAAVDRYHLCFALGKALEDRAEYAESFSYYERGNALKRSELDFRIELIEHNTRLQRAVCTREFFAARRGWGCPDPAPIFIVGLPRSGSTLLEQILASHSQVEGTMELADIPRLVHRLQGRDADPARPRYPRLLQDASAAQLRAIGEEYLNDTRIYRSGRAFFIDKMPNNFRHIGLIHLMLPNSKIIDARREAMACCFGNFKQLFATGQEFTYAIDDIARYHGTYVDLMDHWDHALPGRILRVQYETLVGDLECQVRRLLDFCGLPFEADCLEFHKNARSVRTASSEQVRRPLYTEGLDRWRRFAPWLGPLQAAMHACRNNKTTNLERDVS